jgi:hypothetical protein
LQAAALAKDVSFDFIDNELTLPSLVLWQIASAGGFPEVAPKWVKYQLSKASAAWVVSRFEFGRSSRHAA